MRHNTGRGLVVVGLLAVVTGIPLVCQGRVFLKLGRWFFPALAEGVTGGRLVHEANFRINGGRARVSVLECPSSAESVARALGAGVAVVTAGIAAEEPVRIWEQVNDQRRVRWVAVEPTGRAGCVLFGIEQAAGQAGVVRAAGTEGAIPGLSALPEARTTFAAVNEDTRTALTIVRVKGAAESLAASMEGELRQQGWQPALAGTPAASCGVLVRGQEVCCVWVRRAEAVGECWVAILHKRTM